MNTTGDRDETSELLRAQEVKDMSARHASSFGVLITPTERLLECVEKKKLSMESIRTEHSIAWGNPLLIDVREEPEMAVSVIPYSVSKAEFERDMIDKLDEQTWIVVYCTAGKVLHKEYMQYVIWSHTHSAHGTTLFAAYRSSAYAKRLTEQHGFVNVSAGEGILAWTFHSDHLAIRSKEGWGALPYKRTNRVHTYASQWDIAGKSFQTVQFSILESIVNAAWEWYSAIWR